MSIFGWSLPAGCNNVNLPGEEDYDDRDEITPTPEQCKQIVDLREILYNFKSKIAPVTLDNLFGDTVGDFEDEGEAGDDFVYYCDDCHTWHTVCYSEVVGRKNGKRFVELHTYSDGDWEMTDSWEEGEDFSEISAILTERVDDYFKDWAEYWLDCADNAQGILEQGHDPVNNILDFNSIKPENLIQFFIDAAKEDIKYLEM